ncbi:MAG: hypothetical protein LH632_03255 [Rhodoferax sp.]|nr:hypothetical protein [Rhodoferax sp.]
MKHTHHLTRLALACAVLLASATGPTYAQETKTEGNLRIAGGPGGKVYALMVKDMLAVCGSSVNFNGVASSGGLQNLTMLSANEADLAIVQFDTWQQMKGSDENIAGLQSVMPLHNNLLHVLTLSGGSRINVKTIMGVPVKGTGETRMLRKFSELKGMGVALVGSAQVMGQELEKRLGYNMKLVVADSDDDALAMLRAGQVQAVFTLGGWPLPAITRHKASSGLMLADYDLAPQAPYMAVKRNYNNLESLNLTFLGVPNVLLTRPFKPEGAVGTRVVTLQRCLRQKLDELQEGQYQPGWKEIQDPLADTGIPPFPGTLGAPKVAKAKQGAAKP